MIKYIDVEKLIANLERQNVDKKVIEPVIRIITALQQEQPETDMKSPFTGGKVVILSREEEVTFRGEKVKIIRKYYRCVDTGREFTDGKLDDDMMWAVFRAYCEKKGMTSFTDIMLKQEQPEVELEKEYKEWWENKVSGNMNIQHTAEWYMHETARHFYELGLKVKSDAPKIKGWVARDKRGTLNFFRAHPRRITDSRGEEYWIGHVRMKQPNEFFPDLKWEDEPIEVELTISRVKIE